MPSPSSPARRAWESLTAFGPHGDAHWVALRAGVCMGAPLLLLWSIDRLDLALPATFGAFTVLYGRANAHRSRAAMQATAAAVLVLAVATGTTLAATHAGPWLVVAALSATSAVAMLASIAWAWHPPGALFAVFSVGATASVGASGSDVAVHTAVALGHAYWASVGAAAATSGPSTGHRVNRGLHRAVGTLVGVVVAGALLSLDLGPLPTILVVISLLVVLAWDRWLSRRQRGSR